MNRIVSSACTIDDAIQIRRDKIITLLYELVKVKIDQLRVESNYEKKEKIQQNILEQIDKLSGI